MSDQHTPKVRAQDHDSYSTYSIIAFLIPLVGFILGIVMLTKDEKIDKKLGEHVLVVSIIGGILWSIAWGVYVSTVATNSIQSLY